MSESTRILAIRHGETAWNADTRIQGHTDIPLNAQGLAQARHLAQHLRANDALHAIYSSDLSRAHQTALAVGQALDVPVQIHTGLRERGFGQFEGRSFAQIETEHPQQALQWRQRVPDWIPPGGGESLVQLQARIVRTVDELAARHPGQQIALFAHGGVMDILYRAACRLDLQAPRTWMLGNTAINRLLWSPEGLTLVGWGDTTHLDAMAGTQGLDETST